MKAVRKGLGVVQFWLVSLHWDGDEDEDEEGQGGCIGGVGGGFETPCAYGSECEWQGTSKILFQALPMPASMSRRYAESYPRQSYFAARPCAALAWPIRGCR